jgi:crotonobetainyl-CoA:carnitine CoA-transferase CaiB-like acyl-CoA transferase
LRVVDLGHGMPAAIAARLLSLLGAHIERFEPEAGDPFYGSYPAYRLWHAQSTLRRGLGGIEGALASADVVLVGGEDYPGYEWKFDAGALSEGHPNLIVVQLCGYATEDLRERPAVDLLVQGRTGFAASE